MIERKWTIGLADNGHTYTATALYLTEPETWSVLIRRDNTPYNALLTDNPCSDALKFISDLYTEDEANKNGGRMNPTAAIVEEPGY